MIICFLINALKVHSVSSPVVVSAEVIAAVVVLGTVVEDVVA